MIFLHFGDILINDGVEVKIERFNKLDDHLLLLFFKLIEEVDGLEPVSDYCPIRISDVDEYWSPFE